MKFAPDLRFRLDERLPIGLIGKLAKLRVQERRATQPPRKRSAASTARR